MHGIGATYQAWVPDETVHLYRLIAADLPVKSDFLPNRDAERLRSWPGRGEDWLLFLGLSMWDDPTAAEELARSIQANRRGKPPLWTHVTLVPVDGHSGFAVASTRGDRHFTVWGDPDGLLEAASSSRQTPVPISGPVG